MHSIRRQAASTLRQAKIRPFCAVVRAATPAAQRWATTQAGESGARTDTPKEKAPAPKQVKLTADSYPELKRDERFAKLTKEDVEHFKSICSAPVIEGLSTDASDDLEPHNADWMRKYRGTSQCVLKPKTTEEVSKILKYCNERSLAVVPQGGNTGLVGGSVPVFDEIVINLSNMSNIRSFDPVSGAFVCDAGVILEVADNYLAERNHIFPLDLGAKGSCHVGGNVATNAGGLRLLRYGSLHGTVLGLEVVLPDGTIMNNLNTLRKDNTGYDLKHLFIGAEGTIGIITGVSILCPQRSAAKNVAFFGVESYEKVQEAYIKAKEQLSEILSAFEFMDGAAHEIVTAHNDVRRPLADQHPFYIVIETSGSNKEHDDEKLGTFLEDLMEKEIVSDGVVAENETQASTIWGLREGISESLSKLGGTYKYDVSIPLKELYSMVTDTKTHLEKAGLVGEGSPVVDVVGYGHLGDGNLHLNIPVRYYDKSVEKALEPFVYEWLEKRSGSISAEHGLGVAKKPFLKYSKNEVMIRLMGQIKKLYDPKGIMNPYKYVPEA
ncbi:FAD linked oxidase [Saitoella complicata NRRL Y-17804]|uniref:D-2-hydroxyglutarate dehydrogenase, mitochondrial n=1 Tax=Saitoella complicata (strain BCRC 22490 / CBS 7301 / JCM 7358 / NBRC 10748 / NRRL Y-17804) TaxID=698492 RepID=A0A0E9NHH1_SAICN|nr:FAD linked oxidase [Saitoella complicata NRRL Y-17804]ODQ54052.1 FAD linked oxidase [Saitoella complicata NRRL Y-17804]GAO49126.1 hypothetical protein G7K_3284-t1 [Saitoella complicata NRRL Y-17804]